jgi:hypothetical protein
MWKASLRELFLILPKEGQHVKHKSNIKNQSLAARYLNLWFNAMSLLIMESSLADQAATV